VTPPTFLTYDFGGQSEFCLCFGERHAARTIIIIPPLFDEMNRTRRMLVEVMRTLAGRGICSLLPDLPGFNESLANISKQTVGTWRQALEEAAVQLNPTHIVSLRGGTLIDDVADRPILRLAPVKGASLLKTMLRSRLLADKEAGINSTIEGLMASAESGFLELSGYNLSDEMLQSIQDAAPSTSCQFQEIALADIDGTPLWLRAEPQDDARMSAAFADKLDVWSATCAK
jgi:hypothetical protein